MAVDVQRGHVGIVNRDIEAFRPQQVGNRFDVVDVHPARKIDRQDERPGDLTLPLRLSRPPGFCDPRLVFSGLEATA